MNQKFGKDLTSGSVPIHLLRFAVPMLLGNLFQVGYSIVNAIWIGHIVGENGVGATAVSLPIQFILISLASGVTMATTILVSQYYGSKNFNGVERVIDNSVSLALIITVVLTALGIYYGDFLLRLMDTPQDIYDVASSYLTITLSGFIFVYFGILFDSILRGMGDSVTPLFFKGAGLLLNTVLDPFLIIGIGPFPKLGLNGAAYASNIAAAFSVIVALVYFYRKSHVIKIRYNALKLYSDLTLKTFKIGFPSAVQMSLWAIGMASITSYVNAFGAAAINAYGAVGRIDSFAILPALSIGMATSALTGQNLGARKPQRVYEIVKWGVFITSTITIIITTVVVGIPGTLLKAFGFGDDPVGIEIGVSYLQIIGSCYVLFALMFVFNGVINGAGQTMITLVLSVFSLWGVRVPLAYFLSKTSMGITGIWIAVVVSITVTVCFSFCYFLSGKWKTSVVHEAEVDEGGQIVDLQK